MALVRIYQKPAGTPANSSVFAVEIQQNNIWYTKKVSWEDLKGLIAGATSLVFNNGTVTFTTPDGVAHEVLSVDDEVLAASGNPVTGGAVSTALAEKQDTLTFDQTPTDGSTNPVESNGIYDALALKQDTLTFDSTPTDGSTNPVTSQGIYAAISAVTSGIDWKEAVPTYADIATTYPNPEDGWTVTTLDDDHTYRYNGSAWVDLFSLITLATTTKDGLMSSSDFTKLSGIEAGATRTIVDDALSTSSTNPVQNKVITGKLNAFLDVNETIAKNPYTKKIVPSGKYTEKLRKIIGATVNWNQLVNVTATTATDNDVTFTVNADKTITVNGTASANTYFTVMGSKTYTEGHIYLIRGTQPNTTNCTFRLRGQGNDAIDTTGNGIVWKATSGQAYKACVIVVASGTVCNNFVIRPIVTDLTAMFGSTIADYVNTLETQTAGSGIAWLKSYGFFTEDYYAYSTNTMQSVSVSAKVNKDSEDTTISTVALDHTTLRGLFKLDANNNLYADGDEYTPDGSGSSNYGTHTFDGTESLTRLTTQTEGWYCFAYTLPNSNSVIDVIDYVFDYGESILNRNYDGSNITKEVTFRYGNGIRFTAQGSDETTARAKIVGHTITYKKATASALSLTPYEKLQPIEQGGTEEFVDYGVQSSTRDVAIPAGNETAYGDNENMGKIINYMNT